MSKINRALIFAAGYAILLAIASSIDAHNVRGGYFFGPAYSVVQGGGGGADKSGVIAYFNCDSITNGQAITYGTGTVTVGANVTLVTTAPVNNGLSHNAGFSAGQFSISSANINVAQGCTGFYWHPNNNSAGTVMYFSTNTTGSLFTVTYVSGSNYSFQYLNESNTKSISSGSAQFIEWCWDNDESAGFSSRVRVDNGAWTTQTGSTGIDPYINPALRWGPNDGNIVPGWFDQVLISSDPLKDLYSLRNETSYP